MWLGVKRYQGLAGDSGVTAYQFEDDAIIIEFVDGRIYVYNSVAPGSRHVKRMKELAELGRGLATYINQFVRGNYAEKIK